MSLAVLKKPVCRNCQYNILQSFATIVGIPLLPGSSPGRILAPELSQRWYTQTRPKLFDDPANSRGSPTFDGKDENSSEAPADTISSQLTLIPWYLQVDVPKHPAPSHSLAERQMIPELPENPPTILSPILNHLSIDSGLDNLSLIDLRHLNPPPALGANLLMIIGTARSVKHLNVSADRFCRWLRNNYQIRPYADGLLGRNELKLKLRRKARRQKLAQSVGNTLESSRDDGITTGWVCVNLGSVKGVRDRVRIAEDEDGDQATQHDAEETEQDFELSDVGYIGFGSRYTAPRIVVQMFTEEKRAEMDLEGLWEARTTRRAIREEKLKATDDTQSANDIDDEQFAAQSSLTGFDVDPTASREDHDQPRPFYATAAS